MAYGASAGAETTITLGGDLGFSAVVGLSKDGEAFDYATFASINLDIEKSTNSGLIFGGKVTLNALDELELSLFDDVDPFGVEERRLIRKTVDGPTDIQARVFPALGGMALAESDVVAVKINSDWLSLGGTRSAMDLPFPPLMAENICMLAGRLADGMNGREATFENTPTPAVAVNFRTAVGNGLRRDNEIFVVDAAGTTGKYAPAGQFLAQRKIWAANPITTTAVVPKPSVVHGPGAFGARISLNADGAGEASVAAVFETRFQSVTIKPDSFKTSDLPTAVWQSTASQSATVLFSPGPSELAGLKVNNAKVFVAPFAEVLTIASSEKLVRGAVCLEQSPFEYESDAYMQPISKLLSYTAASVFIEGGFGSLTISTEDHAGIISGNGPWADIVSLSAENGVMFSGELSVMGVSAAAAAVPRLDTRAFNTIAGAKIDLGGVSVGADILFDADIAGVLDAWQLEAAIAPLPASQISMGLDSENSWWLEGEIAGPQFSAEGQIGRLEDALDDQPLYWITKGELDLTIGTLSAEYDQMGTLAFGVASDVAGGEIFARIEGVGEEINLRFGSTLSF